MRRRWPEHSEATTALDLSTQSQVGLAKITPEAKAYTLKSFNMDIGHGFVSNTAPVHDYPLPL